jgi:hypothetical protein
LGKRSNYLFAILIAYGKLQLSMGIFVGIRETHEAMW